MLGHRASWFRIVDGNGTLVCEGSDKAQVIEEARTKHPDGFLVGEAIREDGRVSGFIVRGAPALLGVF